ncbi:MAG: fliE [Caulobacteraceae bacterium]|nr:fliE [Caulobacteraceae bacterium]
MVSPLSAANAYASVQKAAQSLGGAGGDAAAVPGGGSFGDMLKGVMNDTIASTKNAESLMSAQVQGKAQLVDVVTAISSAETSLQTVMAVRDQVISAYQEIMRMTI